MKQIILTLNEEEDGLVGMVMTEEKDNPTRSENIVSEQLANSIMNGKIKSATIARGEGKTIEEARQQAQIIRDIYNSGRTHD